MSEFAGIAIGLMLAFIILTGVSSCGRSLDRWHARNCQATLIRCQKDGGTRYQCNKELRESNCVHP